MNYSVTYTYSIPLNPYTDIINSLIDHNPSHDKLFNIFTHRKPSDISISKTSNKITRCLTTDKNICCDNEDPNHCTNETCCQDTLEWNETCPVTDCNCILTCEYLDSFQPSSKDLCVCSVCECSPCICSEPSVNEPIIEALISTLISIKETNCNPTNRTILKAMKSILKDTGDLDEPF